jgi:cobalamin biosynthesis protein CobW
VPKLPMTIFTGFLGSGKTTLLASLLAVEREQRFAIVVNEFGDVAVDDLLLQRSLDAHRARVFTLSRGLIAYADDDFVSTMHAISEAAWRFDHVLIETSGLAIPTAALEALHSATLQEHFVHDATLTIVDTPLLLAGVYETGRLPSAASDRAAAIEVFQQQLLCADVVVLNKIDHCAEDDLLRAEATVRTRASDVRFVELAWHARLDARLVLGLHLNEFRAQVPGAARGQTHGDGHAHSGLGPHEHGLMTHEHVHEEDPGWLSFVLRSQTAQVPDTLHKALDVIATHEPVLRVKGFAHVGHAAGPLLVQGVRRRIACTLETTEQAFKDSKFYHIKDETHAGSGPPYGHTPLHSHTHGTITMAELVFIGYHLDRERVVAQLRQHTGTAWY